MVSAYSGMVAVREEEAAAIMDADPTPEAMDKLSMEKPRFKKIGATML